MHKLINRKNKKLLITASNFSLNHLGMVEDDALQDINNIKITILTHIEGNMWNDREKENTRKLNFYKEIVNPELEDHNYHYIVGNSERK